MVARRADSMHVPLSVDEIVEDGAGCAARGRDDAPPPRPPDGSPAWERAAFPGVEVFDTGMACLAHELLRRAVITPVGRVSLRTSTPLFVDPSRRSRVTGSFILIDQATTTPPGAA